jgi:hypothetical protein
MTRGESVALQFAFRRFARSDTVRHPGVLER